jgi:hypothetical protein
VARQFVVSEGARAEPLATGPAIPDSSKNTGPDNLYT